MAEYRVINDLTEIPRTGRCSVITTDSCSCINPIPDAVVIDTYQDGELLEDKQQYFETSDVGDDILGAELEANVLVQADAESTYNTMNELAEEFRNANGNYEVYAKRLEERMRERAEEETADSDDFGDFD